MSIHGFSSPDNSSPKPSSAHDATKANVFDFARHPGRAYLGDEYVNIQGKSPKERREALKILSTAVRENSSKTTPKEQAPILFRNPKATRHSYVGYQRKSNGSLIANKGTSFGRLGTFITNEEYDPKLNPVPSDKEIGFNPASKFPVREFSKPQQDFEVYAREVEIAKSDYYDLEFEARGIFQSISSSPDAHNSLERAFEMFNGFSHLNLSRYENFEQLKGRAQAYPAALFNADQRRYDLNQKSSTMGKPSHN